MIELLSNPIIGPIALFIGAMIYIPSSIFTFDTGRTIQYRKLARLEERKYPVQYYRILMAQLFVLLIVAAMLEDVVVLFTRIPLLLFLGFTMLVLIDKDGMLKPGEHSGRISLFIAGVIAPGVLIFTWAREPYLSPEMLEAMTTTVAPIIGISMMSVYFLFAQVPTIANQIHARRYGESQRPGLLFQVGRCLSFWILAAGYLSIGNPTLMIVHAIAGIGAAGLVLSYIGWAKTITGYVIKARDREGREGYLWKDGERIQSISLEDEKGRNLSPGEILNQGWVHPEKQMTNTLFEEAARNGFEIIEFKKVQASQRSGIISLSNMPEPIEYIEESFGVIVAQQT